MYSHTGTGLQKASHERMMGDQGRKVVKERLGHNVNSYDHYKNLREEQASDFDNAWQRMAKDMGFSSNMANNRLEFGSSGSYTGAHRQS